MVIGTFYRIDEGAYFLGKFMLQGLFGTLGVTGFDPETDTLFGATLGDENHINIGLFEGLEDTAGTSLGTC